MHARRLGLNLVPGLLLELEHYRLDTLLRMIKEEVLKSYFKGGDQEMTFSFIASLQRPLVAISLKTVKDIEINTPPPPLNSLIGRRMKCACLERLTTVH